MLYIACQHIRPPTEERRDVAGVARSLPLLAHLGALLPQAKADGKAKVGAEGVHKD